MPEEMKRTRGREKRAAERSAVPSYAGLKAYDPGREALLAFGVSTVQQLVARFNADFVAAGQFPVTQGDFPATRRKFERLVDRWTRLTRANG
jgi:hypothetical protein